MTLTNQRGEYYAHFFFVILAMFCLCSTVSGQTNRKYEKEARIDSDEVPAPARDFMSGLIKVHKIKWYEEKGLERISYEAKFKAFDHRYSVEFDDEGVLEDIEVLIKMDEVPEPARTGIMTYLREQYEHASPRRIQRQYVGPPHLMPTMVSYDYEVPDEVQTRYEIVFCGKTDEGKQLYEGLFDAEGRLLKRSVVILRGTDNLEF